jgi:hypothetical protein
MCDRSQGVQPESGYTIGVVTCNRSREVRPESGYVTRVGMYDRCHDG